MSLTSLVTAAPLETETARHHRGCLAVFLLFIVLELKLQRKLNNSRGFALLDNGLRRRWRYRRTTGLRKQAGSYTGRAARGISWIVEVRVVERIKHFRSELQLEALSNRESLDETEIEIPITGRGKDVSAGAVPTGCRNAEVLSRVSATRQSSHRRE